MTVSQSSIVGRVEIKIIAHHGIFLPEIEEETGPDWRHLPLGLGRFYSRNAGLFPIIQYFTNIHFLNFKSEQVYVLCYYSKAHGEDDTGNKNSIWGNSYNGVALANAGACLLFGLFYAGLFTNKVTKTSM